MAVMCLVFLGTTGCRAKTYIETVNNRATADNDLIHLKEQSSFTLLDVFVIIDQSGSMSEGVRPTDPSGKRIAATERLIYSLMLKSDPDAPHRLGVVNFGTYVPEEHVVSLTPLVVEKDVETIVSKLEPLNLSWTNFMDAFERVEKGFVEAGTYDMQRKPVIIIFTDGQPDDSRRLKLDQYFEEIKTYLETTLREAEIFLIAIDTTGEYWYRCKDYWAEVIPEKNLYQLEDMDELPEKFNEIIRVLFGIPDILPEVVDAAGLEFEVQPYLEAMELLPFPASSDLELQIIKPDGKVLDFDNQGVYTRNLVGGQIICIEKPEPGKWHYEIAQGKGEITIFRNTIPVNVKLYFPSLNHPIGKKNELIAFFAYRDGTQVESHAEYPLNLFVELISPNGSEQTLPLQEFGSGFYHSMEELDFMEEGAYLLGITARGGDRYVNRSNYTLHTADYPYLVFEAPVNHSTVNLNSALKITVRCHYQGKPIDPTTILKGPPASMALIQPISLTQTENSNELTWMNPQPGSGCWMVNLPCIDNPGTYHLVARLVGELRTTGEDIAVDTFITFHVKFGFWVLFKDALIYVALILAALLAVLLTYFFVWYIRLPLMKGVLNLISEDNRRITVRLNRKKIVCRRMKRKGARGNGWVIIYTKSWQNEYVILRWSKRQFRQAFRLRFHEQRTLNSWKAELY